MPLSEKYLTMLRNFIPKAGKLNPTVLPIESAGAIAAVTGYYQSYELPKGTLRGSPPIPDDDMRTLRIPFYLVATKKLSDDVAGALAKAIMSARQDRIGQDPFVAQISKPDTDKDSGDDTYIPAGLVAYMHRALEHFVGLGELRGLRWSDVDLDAGLIHVRQRASQWFEIGPPKIEGRKARHSPCANRCEHTASMASGLP